MNTRLQNLATQVFCAREHHPDDFLDGVFYYLKQRSGESRVTIIVALAPPRSLITFSTEHQLGQDLDSWPSRITYEFRLDRCIRCSCFRRNRRYLRRHDKRHHWCGLSSFHCLCGWRSQRYCMTGQDFPLRLTGRSTQRRLHIAVQPCLRIIPNTRIVPMSTISADRITPDSSFHRDIFDM